MRTRKSLLILIGFAGAVGAIAILWHMRFLRESRPAVAVAVATAGRSREVTSILGVPIAVTHVTGRVIGVGDPDSGNADLAIDVSGPKGTGKLLEWAQNGYQGWHLCSLSFFDSAGRDTVLIPDEDAKCERE